MSELYPWANSANRSTPCWARFALFADYTWERFEIAMASRYRGVSSGAGTDDPLDDWFSDTIDRYDTITMGFDASWGDERWRLNA